MKEESLEKFSGPTIKYSYFNKLLCTKISVTKTSANYRFNTKENIFLLKNESKINKINSYNVIVESEKFLQLPNNKILVYIIYKLVINYSDYFLKNMTNITNHAFNKTLEIYQNRVNLKTDISVNNICKVSDIYLLANITINFFYK